MFHLQLGYKLATTHLQYKALNSHLSIDWITITCAMSLFCGCNEYRSKLGTALKFWMIHTQKGYLEVQFQWTKWIYPSYRGPTSQQFPTNMGLQLWFYPCFSPLAPEAFSSLHRTSASRRWRLPQPSRAPSPRRKPGSTTRTSGARWSMAPCRACRSWGRKKRLGWEVNVEKWIGDEHFQDGGLICNGDIQPTRLLCIWIILDINIYIYIYIILLYII